MISQKAKAKIVRHQELMALKKKYGMYRFHLYIGRDKFTTDYIVSRSEWLAIKNHRLKAVLEPNEFLAFIDRFSYPNNYIYFTFDEQPGRRYTNIEAFIEEFLITKLAGI